MYILLLKDGQGNINACQVQKEFFEEWLLTEAHKEYFCKSELVSWDQIYDDTDDPTIIEFWKTKYYVNGETIGYKFSFVNKCDY